MSAVTLEEVKDSEDGFQYWCELSLGPKSGYAGSSAGTTAGSSAGRQTPAKADRIPKTQSPGKTKAKAAPKPGAANVENEKSARNLLANYQLAINAMARVNAAADETPKEWNWAGQDREEFKNEEMALHQLWQKGKMTGFVQDLRAAVFSPSAVRAFKKRYDAVYRRAGRGHCKCQGNHGLRAECQEATEQKGKILRCLRLSSTKVDQLL